MIANQKVYVLSNSGFNKGTVVDRMEQFGIPTLLVDLDELGIEQIYEGDAYDIGDIPDFVDELLQPLMQCAG